MKKKIFIGMAALFFAAVTFYNVQVNQNNGDISLENVALMAQASGESGGTYKVCMRTGGGIRVYARLCRFHGGTIPPDRCGHRRLIRNGLRYVQCF